MDLDTGSAQLCGGHLQFILMARTQGQIRSHLTQGTRHLQPQAT